MRTISIKGAVRHTFYRLGLHTRPEAIIHALLEQGIHVTEELIRQVRFDMLKENKRGRLDELPRPVRSPAVRRCPKGFPGRK